MDIGKCCVNCSLASCFLTGRCKGCGSEDRNQKRISKWRCKIRTCVIEKGLHHCGECPDFPCRLRASPDKRYREKYSIDLIKNGIALRDISPDEWLKEQRREYTCPACGG